ncbi:putative membrane protein [Buttiauxella sp. BIGb0471]|uniref:bestrophin family protein n=1 Tax=Buttiauxella sp. BIGb0471 TaxID=2940597 RepID=UPI00216836CE|nr:bestrophin family ion channel [Buttiauxella sp. BIGb0471]MCS3602037.1 putative membrane protein [Buttiauxella sp. BIGb0471]
MIVRPHQHWFIRLFVWHGSVLQKIYSRLLLNLALSIGIIFFLPWYETLGIKLTTAPFSILGVAIAIFLGFRNSACYARFNEARTLWGNLAITQRSFLREAKSVLGENQSQISALVNLQTAFCHALRLTLRKRPVEETLKKYLSAEELQWVVKSQAPCQRILLLMGSWLGDKRKQGLISDVVWSSLNHHLNDLSAVAGGCERIASTPVPFAYTLILHRTVYLFCIMLPFALVTDLHYMTPFLSVFISYTFISLDTLAEELEEPFGTEDNDLPLDAICNSIERDLHDMDESEKLPEKLRPNRHYRLS